MLGCDGGGSCCSCFCCHSSSNFSSGSSIVVVVVQVLLMTGQFLLISLPVSPFDLALGVGDQSEECELRGAGKIPYGDMVLLPFPKGEW